MVEKKVLKLTTECPCELFVGLFGIDADGNQPECGHCIEVETDQYEIYRDEFHLLVSVTCPNCQQTLDPGDAIWSEI